jgi:adenine-specific DNA-methyltransferase
LATSGGLKLMATRKRRSTKTTPKKPTQIYKHPEAELLLRPEVGTQAQFRKKKLPTKYRYDDSLSPTMEWESVSLRK